MNSHASCSQTIKLTGRFAIACNAFAAFAVLMFDFQSGGHGEMGSFYHGNLIWILLFAGWGIGTGVGLLRAWPWARVSTLTFSGLLTGMGLLGIVAVLRVSAGNSGGNFLMLTALPALLALIPSAVGVWWLVFFNRSDVKAYFQTGRNAA